MDCVYHHISAYATILYKLRKKTEKCILIWTLNMSTVTHKTVSLHIIENAKYEYV